VPRELGLSSEHHRRTKPSLVPLDVDPPEGATRHLHGHPQRLVGRRSACQGDGGHCCTTAARVHPRSTAAPLSVLRWSPLPTPHSEPSPF
jgi:hypothetical protein